MTEPGADPTPEPTESDRGGFALSSVGRSAVILTGATLVAQLVVMARELFLAAQAGASSQVDALLIATVLPTSLGGVLTRGTLNALVPPYLAARSTGGLREAQRFAGAVLLWVSLGSLVVWIALDAFAGLAVSVTGSGLPAQYQSSAVQYLHIVAPIAFVSGISGILFAVCQAEEYFAPVAWATVGTSVTTLVIMLLLWDRLGLTAYAVGTLAGPIAGLVILLVAAMRRSIAPRPRLILRGIGLGAYARHSIPLTVSAAILQLNSIVDLAIASLIAPGAVSALRYGQLLVNVPAGAIGLAWGRAIYPALVRSTLLAGESQLANATDRALRYVIAVFVPIAALTSAVAPLIVSVVYSRGAFGNASVDLTSQVVFGLAPVMVIGMATPVLTGSINARRHGTLLLIGGIMNVTLNSVLDVALGPTLGVGGIALSSSIATATVLVFFARRFARMEKAFRLPPLTRTLGLAIAAAAPGAVVLGAVAWTGPVPSDTFAGLVALAVVGTAGMASYLLIAVRIGLSEPRTMLELGVRTIGRKFRDTGTPT